MALTDSFLKSIAGKPYTGTPEITDGDGLSIRVTPKGIITFQVRHAIRGDDGKRKQVRTSLGKYPLMSLKEARIRAAEKKEGVQDSVLDNEPTPKELVEEWLEKYVARECREGTQQNYRYTFSNVMNRLPEKPVNKITMDQWLNYFDAISERSSGSAYNVITNLKTCFNWHVRRGTIKPPVMMSLRAKDVGATSSVGSRVLTVQEVCKIWKALESSRASAENKIVHQLCLVYGCRITEARTVRDVDLDFDAMVWTVPAEISKTGKPIRRPITSIGKELFDKGLMLTRSGDYLFEGANKGKPIDVHSCNRLLGRLRLQLEIPYFRIHDARRTLSTRLSEMGVLPHVTETMLGHTLSGIMAVYNKHDWIVDQREAYEQWWEVIKAELLSR